ncbi:MAG: SDR family oxidoreductase [Anaerolineae bacterium]|nr:SDR family oxidoreductase [Anaerolineae bacterium]
MKTQLRKVILITGASSGIGAACAAHLARCGYRVYGTSRQERHVEGFTMLPMDVTDAASIRRVVDHVAASESRLDVLINNAGFGYGGSIEDTSHEEALDTFATNFFGALSMCRAVLPVMRQQHSGLIINVSSIGGLMGMPYQGVYSASKFALEGLTETLRLEVKPFGVQVVLLEPGDVRTSFTANRSPTGATQAGSVYWDTYRRVLERFEADERNGVDPSVIARTVERIVASRSPRLRYVAGPFYEMLAVWAKRCLPAGLFEWILAKNFGL